MSQSMPFTLPLHANFDAAQLASARDLCWLSEADTVLGLCALLAAVNRGNNWSVAALTRGASRTNRTPFREAVSPAAGP